MTDNKDKTGDAEAGPGSCADASSRKSVSPVPAAIPIALAPLSRYELGKLRLMAFAALKGWGNCDSAGKFIQHGYEDLTEVADDLFRWAVSLPAQAIVTGTAETPLGGSGERSELERGPKDAPSPSPSIRVSQEPAG